MPWRGFEPRRLSALPPQDSVSTSFTTRARRAKRYPPRPRGSTPPPTGLEGDLPADIEHPLVEGGLPTALERALIQLDGRTDGDGAGKLDLVAGTGRPCEPGLGSASPVEEVDRALGPTTTGLEPEAAVAHRIELDGPEDRREALLALVGLGTPPEDLAT